MLTDSGHGVVLPLGEDHHPPPLLILLGQVLAVPGDLGDVLRL